MAVMSKMNCGVLYSIKLKGELTSQTAITNFMSKYTDTPYEYYNSYMIEQIVSNAIAELLDHVKHPSFIWHEYQERLHFPWNMNSFDAMCSILCEVQVKENDEYINGFRPIEEYSEFFKEKN